VLTAQEVLDAFGQALHSHGSIGAAVGPEARLNLVALNLFIHVFQVLSLAVVHMPEENHRCTLPGSLLFDPLPDTLAHEKWYSPYGLFGFFHPFHPNVLSISRLNQAHAL
jgi:hypothetical protein